MMDRPVGHAPPSPSTTIRAALQSSGRSFRALAGGLTPLDAASASAHLTRAYSAHTGEAPSSEALGLLWAQWALETARGQAMYGNNFGGIKATRGQSSATLATIEGHGAQSRRIKDRFRTYATAADGARDYVGLLARRFPDAFAALQRGDLDGFARGLERGRYFTADPATYRSALQRLAAEHGRGPAHLASPASPLQAIALDGLRWALSRTRDD